MIGHENRGRVVVDVDGNWRLYTNSLPAGCTALGTVTRDDGETGALVRTEAGIYSMLNGRTYRSLDGRKVSAALGTAGRPSEMAGGKKVNTYLDAESVAIAKRLGNGNVSEGIRTALKRIEQTACLKCWHPRGDDWLDDGETCPVCKTVS